MDTPTSTTIDHEIARLSAREHVLRFLSLAASDPAARRFEDFLDPDFQDLACAAARHLAADQASQPAQLAPGEVSPENLDLAPLVEAANVPRPQLVEDYTQVFGLVVSKECPPYEVQYCPQTFSVFRSQHLADIAGFYHAFGVAPGRDAPEREDHLACELEFLAWLVAKERHALAGEGDDWAERVATCRDAQRSFVTEHVAWWVPAFARALRERADSLTPPAAFQAAFSDALAAFIPVERAALDVPPPQILAEPRPDDEQAGEGCAGCGSEEGSG